MNWKLSIALLVIVALGGFAATALLRHRPGTAAAGGHDHHGHSHDHGGHAGHAETGTEKGPHGGRLLEDGDVALELAIVERGTPPEFHAWFSKAGKAVPPADVQLTVELTRPGGTVETFTFTPAGDHLRSNTEVREPHSFDYRVVAAHAGRSHRWQFAAPEMQVTIPAETAARAGVKTDTAGPATLTESLAVYGQVKLNANRIGRAIPRFGGIVREARKAIGDTVVAGEVVAIVESNQSLVSLEVKAPVGGVIVDRDVNAGETVADGATLYLIADLADVWIDLNVPKRDHGRVRLGQAVTVEADDGGAPVKGTITWIAPTASAEAQTLTARVVAPNADHRWHAGLFVKAEITLAESVAPVAVKAAAVQTLFDFTVVFSQHGDVYQARPLQLGRRSGGFVEVLSGLAAGERYVVENSFLIKADIGKAGAAHEH